MGSRRTCLWLVTVIYLCFMYAFITHRQGNNEHGERKRRSTMPHFEETDQLREHLRRNSTDFLLSIEEINFAYTIANDSFIILIPANFSTPIITGFLTADTNVIWDLVTEDIIPHRDLLPGYNYTTLINELLDNTTDSGVGPVLTLDSVNYLVALTGMVGNSSILIAFEYEISLDYNYYNPDLNMNYTDLDFLYGNLSMNATMEGSMLDFYNFSYYPAADLNFSSFNFTDDSTGDLGNSSNPEAFGTFSKTSGAGAFAYSWNAFSGYKHFNKPITVSTFSPPKRSPRRNKEQQKGTGMSQNQNQGRLQGAGFQNFETPSTLIPSLKRDKKVTPDGQKTESNDNDSPSTSNSGKKRTTSSSPSGNIRPRGRIGKG